MKKLLHNIFYSFPIQLFILHFRKYQLLLVFWYLLFSTIDSVFLKSFGADALFFSPEYLGTVNIFGAIIVGVALSVFIMSWNITTFILNSKRCKFLATTSKPFVKYCINNAILPLLLIGFYIFKLIYFDKIKELMTWGEIIEIITGILIGFTLLLAVSFIYFFGAEKTILLSVAPVVGNPKQFNLEYHPTINPQQQGYGLNVEYYFSNRLRLKKVRNVGHYSQIFLNMIFKRHHFAAIICIGLAFVFLITVGFFLDNPFFQVPAAASILIFFAVFTAVIGALIYFLQSWSLPFVLILFLVLNTLYKKEIIDPRNKAYGINYLNKKDRPNYNKKTLQQLCMPSKIDSDKINMISVLENWKKKQHTNKPVMVFINVSGGGLRSATFVMNTLQKLDSITNGKLMKQTFLITGASGGMFAATYYRELYRLKQQKKITENLYDKKFTNNITKDLLNPIFSSMIARDIFSPAQKFFVGDYKYVKDRGYALEQKLNDNTEGILNTQIKDYELDEKAATIPLMIFNSTISRDGRRLMATSQPISFLMKPTLFTKDTTESPDAIDFNTFFKNQSPKNLRLLTALRMNATFPYVLPNVWLPTKPVIDIMDAGLSDNYGEETSLRFIDNFKTWIKENTDGVVILQITDRKTDNWQKPLENSGIADIIVKPATMLQTNWYKLQRFAQNNQYSYLHNNFDSTLSKITFMYVPENERNSAELNFHLTAQEKMDIIESFNNNYNQTSKQQLVNLLK